MDLHLLIRIFGSTVDLWIRFLGPRSVDLDQCMDQDLWIQICGSGPVDPDSIWKQFIYIKKIFFCL